MTVTIFVPDIPEFGPLIKAVADKPGVDLIAPKAGYWQIQAADRLSFGRKALGLRVAMWNSALTGGFCGRLTEYTNDVMTIETDA